MQLEIRGREQYKTSSWSGGQTTELYLYPPTGDYAKRDFMIRVSSATVELEESQFTPLPGVKRHLMILEGRMKLVHENRREHDMKPYDIDFFMGDFETVSYGKVRDFNLMIQGENLESSMQFQEIAKDETFVIQCTDKNFKTMVYVIEGEGMIKNYEVTASNLIVLDDCKSEKCQMKNMGIGSLKLAICMVTQVD